MQQETEVELTALLVQLATVAVVEHPTKLLAHPVNMHIHMPHRVLAFQATQGSRMVFLTLAPQISTILQQELARLARVDTLVMDQVELNAQRQLGQLQFHQTE